MAGQGEHHFTSLGDELQQKLDDADGTPGTAGKAVFRLISARARDSQCILSEGRATRHPLRNNPSSQVLTPESACKSQGRPRSTAGRNYTHQQLAPVLLDNGLKLAALFSLHSLACKLLARRWYALGQAYHWAQQNYDSLPHSSNTDDPTPPSTIHASAHVPAKDLPPVWAPPWNPRTYDSHALTTTMMQQRALHQHHDNPPITVNPNNTAYLHRTPRTPSPTATHQPPHTSHSTLQPALPSQSQSPPPPPRPTPPSPPSPPDIRRLNRPKLATHHHNHLHRHRHQSHIPKHRPSTATDTHPQPDTGHTALSNSPCPAPPALLLSPHPHVPLTADDPPSPILTEPDAKALEALLHLQVVQDHPPAGPIISPYSTPDPQPLPVYQPPPVQGTPLTPPTPATAAATHSHKNTQDECNKAHSTPSDTIPVIPDMQAYQPIPTASVTTTTTISSSPYQLLRPASIAIPPSSHQPVVHKATGTTLSPPSCVTLPLPWADRPDGPHPSTPASLAASAFATPTPGSEPVSSILKSTPDSDSVLSEPPSTNSVHQPPVNTDISPPHSCVVTRVSTPTCADVSKPDGDQSLPHRQEYQVYVGKEGIPDATTCLAAFDTSPTLLTSCDADSTQLVTLTPMEEDTDTAGPVCPSLPMTSPFANTSQSCSPPTPAPMHRSDSANSTATGTAPQDTATIVVEQTGGCSSGDGGRAGGGGASVVVAEQAVGMAEQADRRSTSPAPSNAMTSWHTPASTISGLLDGVSPREELGDAANSGQGRAGSEGLDDASGRRKAVSLLSQALSRSGTGRSSSVVRNSVEASPSGWFTGEEDAEWWSDGRRGRVAGRVMTGRGEQQQDHVGRPGEGVDGPLGGDTGVGSGRGGVGRGRRASQPVGPGQVLLGGAGGWGQDEGALGKSWSDNRCVVQ